MKHLKPPGKILFSEPVRKINLSSHKQNPLSDLMLGVKIANKIDLLELIPSLSPTTPPDAYCNKEQKT